ncbi:BirA family transcriptional regulator, biotin operon repressor / biotin-[acetyl-CoA-carboxylase] ligase [Jannaschia seohaensis]|uniref:biotin--[biotin carboxyl-carrier protein] ligase n=2 Tax=Jannaschia seohaensis TaxID=475081 RepID=A0A2Y9B354_9RHOB|nr:BirA family biotin operon repressor/biotin-[acetyl-CoA-carboxylase] ligase [Jannaschia seohaensis]SSA50974.1 BirA family transcriptional regulator, biotin operon repressor / biotin-[acetyl-CoA-carboxylase] ligase [Jannaschia seohaensis]
MPEGNFAASLTWRPGGAPAMHALRSFTASLALHDALSGMGVAGLTLKWPNDVLLEGGKLAGILLEGSGDRLILGIGINLVAAPGAAEVEPGAVRPVSLLEATGLRVTPEAMLDALAPAFAAREAELVTWGFAPIRRAWLHRAARLGEGVTARTMRETLQGTFEDVDEDGQLVLRTAEGPRRIPAADIFFGPVPGEETEAALCS